MLARRVDIGICMKTTKTTVKMQVVSGKCVEEIGTWTETFPTLWKARRAAKLMRATGYTLVLIY